MVLSNNTILITGGTSGIGLELGKALLKLDNKVILLGRNSTKLEELKKKGFETIKCDIGNQQDIEEAVVRIQNQYPDLNVLFNNAGIQHNYLITDTVIPLDKISDEINVNLTGQIMLTQLLIPILSASKNAFIVNTTSGLGMFPKSGGLIYSATKAAMRNFNLGLRYALKETSIKVLEFMPPVTKTNMTKGRDEKKTSAEDLVQAIIPQLKKDRKLITVPKLRWFRLIAFISPNLAHKIISKE